MAVAAFPSPVCAQITGDPELLQVLLDRVTDNLARIATWEGQASVTDVQTQKKAVAAQSLARLKFAYSSDGDQLHFDKTVERTSGDGGKKIYRYAAIRNKESYYRYGPIDLGQDVRVAVRPFPLASEMKGWLSEDFDPLIFERVDVADKTVRRFLGFYYKNKDEKALLPTKVVQDKEIVVVTVSDVPDDPQANHWVYHFDLSKAGLPVFVQGGRRSGSDIVSTWKTTYVDVEGTWLPDRLEIEIDKQSTETVDSRTIVFSDHQLNKPVDEREFQSESLPIQTGDKVLDPTTGEWSRFGIPEQKKPPTDVGKPADGFSIRQIFVAANAGVVVFLAVVFLVRHVRRLSGRR